MCKVKQIDCIVNYLEAKRPYIFSKNITVHTNTQNIRNLDTEIYKFPVSQIISRDVNDYSLPRLKH